MPKGIGKTAMNAMGAPTQSHNPYATDRPVESVSPADSSPVKTELMPYAAPIKTGPATNAQNQPFLFNDVSHGSFTSA
jgi:hypothetical protein